MKNCLPSPVQDDEVDDALEDPDNDVKDADEEGGEEEDLLGLHHAKDDSGVDE